jgi:hypothetical protein
MALNTNLSDTYNFDPALGEIVIGAYARCGIRRTEITQQHLADARFESNLLQSEMAGEGVNLWQVELYTEPLLAGVATYNVPDTTVFILDVYIRQNPLSGMPIDRLIMPISRSDWAATANKTMPGFPASYWWNQQLQPTITLWPVPQQDGTELRYYRQTRAMDANLVNGTQAQIPFAAYDYFTASLAVRLAVIYAPDRLAMLMPMKQQAYTKYLQASTESTPINMNIEMRSYFRV